MRYAHSFGNCSLYLKYIKLPLHQLNLKFCIFCICLYLFAYTSAALSLLAGFMADFTDRLIPAEPRGPDTLANERAQSSLKVQELAHHLLSRDGFLERQDRILAQLKKERLLSKETQQNLSRPDRYKLGLARAKLLLRMKKKLGWSAEDHKMFQLLS